MNILETEPEPERVLDEPEPEPEPINLDSNVESLSINEIPIDLNELAKYLEENGEKSYNSTHDLAYIVSIITGLNYVYLITMPNFLLYFLVTIFIGLITSGVGIVVVLMLIGFILTFVESIEKLILYSANESIKSIYGLITGPQASNHIHSIMLSLHNNNYYNNFNKDINFWFYKPFYDIEKNLNFNGILIPIYFKEYMRTKKLLLSSENCKKIFYKWQKYRENINNSKIEEKNKIYNDDINKKYDEIESKVEFNFDLNTYIGACLVLSNDQLKSLMTHSFLNNYGYKYIFNLITKIQTEENLPNFYDKDYENLYFSNQDFRYNLIGEIIEGKKKVYFATGPLFMGYLVKLDNNGKIIEYEEGKGIERYKVYLKENGWFTVCDCVTESKEFTDCNPYKFKDDNECWNLKIHTEDGNEKGFYFLNLIDAAFHDSHVSFDCFLSPSIKVKYNQIHEDFMRNNQKYIDEYSKRLQNKQNKQDEKFILGLGGSNKYYNKYMKYKHKYLELKNSL